MVYCRLDSLLCAKRTAECLRQVISSRLMSGSDQGSDLLEAVKTAGTKLVAANPTELVIGNVMRRVMKIIREEEATLRASAVAGEESGRGEEDDRAASEGGRQLQRSQLKENAIDGVNELMHELNESYSEIAQRAAEHIHHNEVILTVGGSEMLFKFLLEAKKQRSFQVTVAEADPRYGGLTLAKELSHAGVQTTVITDAAVFPMMARSNMVLIGAHAVMANGGVIAPAGSHVAALAAKRHAVPFVVLAAIHQLCPVYSDAPDIVRNEGRLASEMLNYGEFSDCMESEDGEPLLQVLNPAFDYIPPELVSLLVTDGTFSSVNFGPVIGPGCCQVIDVIPVAVVLRNDVIAVQQETCATEGAYSHWAVVIAESQNQVLLGADFAALRS
ncbi:hypothetical protein CBR_g42076 [Chara braunii]|uniref:Translation initiation factor eIF2B subunit beta n=1 Tax=Chara braunii TaxID=69332 RepID=A0A388LX10_CHABU|nr:hypothetical protein CBR_g42076 [Chara braunii]|eukprot:GBG86793.1 hypothetical protein CBR_g42076 [Chara braunii]